MVNDLNGVNRTVTPFVVIGSHCPMYSTNKDHYHEWQTVQMLEELEPVFFKYGVDVIFAGHGAQIRPLLLAFSSMLRPLC